MSNNKVFSLDEEVYHDYDEINDILGDEIDIKMVYIAYKIEITHKDLINSSVLIDDIMENAYEKVGDHSENYNKILDAITKEQKQELNNLLANWFNDNIKQPDFYMVDNITEITKEELEQMDSVHEYERN